MVSFLNNINLTNFTQSYKKNEIGHFDFEDNNTLLNQSYIHLITVKAANVLIKKTTPTMVVFGRKAASTLLPYTNNAGEAEHYYYFNSASYLTAVSATKAKLANYITKSATVYPLHGPVVISNKVALSSPFAHHFHLVNPSPWPLFVSVSLWLTMLTTVALFHKYTGNTTDLLLGFGCLVMGAACWWRDIIRESTYEFKHTSVVRQGLLFGMALFIISEAFLFFGFFWAFFHSSLVPSANIGGIWPPISIDVIDPWKLPLVNTLALIMSGFTVTIAHRRLKYVPYHDTFTRYTLVQNMVIWLIVTVGLASFFLFCQAFEYYYASFTLSDTIYGTTFYSLTGLHGMHVIVGTIFLIICTVRAHHLHFTSWKQVGFKSAVWYWHFVDVVWILLFFVVYLWGNAGAGHVLMQLNAGGPLEHVIG